MDSQGRTGRRIEAAIAVWVVCFGWWIASFISEWSQTGWAFIGISSAATVCALLVGVTLIVRCSGWATAVFVGAVTAGAAIVLVDLLAFGIGSNL